MLYKVGGFVSGAAISSMFVFNMNDMIYTQLRRNMIMPFAKVAKKREEGQGGLDKDTITELGKGTLNFVSQFKPLGLEPQSAKQLLMTDQQYGTPSDSYFAYINKRKKNETPEELREIQVLSQLGLENVLPPYYNAMRNRFELQSSDKEIIKEIKEIDPEADIDEIEIARINALRQQNLDTFLENKFNKANVEPSQKFSKQDYKKLEKLNFKSILTNFDAPTEKRRYQDIDIKDQLKEENIPESMIKIERKKKARKSRDERKKAQEEIQRLLENPQDIESRDRAVQLVDEQAIEAKEITQKDVRKLRRLKKKAEREAQKSQGSQQSQTQTAAATPQEVSPIEVIQNLAILESASLKTSAVPQSVIDSQQTLSSRVEHAKIVDPNNLSDANIDELIK